MCNDFVFPSIPVQFLKDLFTKRIECLPTFVLCCYNFKIVENLFVKTGYRTLQRGSQLTKEFLNDLLIILLQYCHNLKY